MSKLLVVFGATSNQGALKEYVIRAITRNASNPAAQSVKERGAEIVQADMDDASTLPSALKGVHTVLLVTNTSYDGNTREVETRQAKATCEEAIKQGVQYIIWSNISHPFKISSGKLQHVEHFDDKAEIEQYIRGLPVKSAFYAPRSFMQNFFSKIAPKPTQIPLIDITDTEKWIGTTLAEPGKFEGKFFAATERLYSYNEITEIISKATGKTVTHKQIAEKNMKEEVKWTAKQARGHLTTLEEFLKKNPLKWE
ncbi:NAD(P)-binding protein [Zopfia rhizophila CBS 207.26]|uniref:NAD(P)-binding protein n=1 Tax=Zopfia rhizophila CBS 207.26 TaxID=1314779 RepID=A0A6A6EKL9_9PEZI|nr:NAD(P)-binding protein [Zopfia rhizophila CBS 207.26]